MLKAGAVVFCQNPARLADFYQQALGFNLTLNTGDKWILESPYMALTLLSPCPAHAETGKRIKLIVPVDNLPDCLLRIPAAGGQILDITFQTHYFTAQDCRDPEGNSLQLRAALP